jgi:transcriptional regulator with XRE-family HTH domain
MAPLTEYRNQRGISQQQLADALGIRSKGHISNIESGFEPAGLRLALQIEAWSDGVVPADSLLSPADAALLATHRRLSAAGAERQLEPEGV